MKKLRAAACVGAMAGVVAIASSCSRPAANGLRIHGSTTIEPLMKAAAEAYSARWGVEIEVTATGSKRGLDELIHGHCDIAMSSTVLSADELGEAEDLGVSIKSFILGTDMIVPIVNPANSLNEVTLSQLQDIFTGKVTNWSKVGGEDQPIVVVVRDASSGTCDVWRRRVGTAKEGEIDIMSTQSSSAALAAVSERVGAIGYCSSVFANPEIKPLAVKDASVLQHTRSHSGHPIERPLSLHINQQHFTGEVRKFVMFLLMTQEGKDLITASGFFATDLQTL